MKVVLANVSGELIPTVIDADGRIVGAAARYIQFIRSVGRRPNTLRSRAYAISNYLNFCVEHNVDPKAVTLEDLGRFVAHLRSPEAYPGMNLSGRIIRAHNPASINVIAGAVVGFYDFLHRHEDFAPDIRKITSSSFRSFASRSFSSSLRGIAAGNAITVSILRQREAIKKPKVIPPEVIRQMVEACSNERDRLMIIFLLESGIRIGELLGLYCEDIDLMRCQIKIRHRDGHTNGASLKTPSAERNLFISRKLIDRISDYLLDVRYPLQVNHNYLFVLVYGHHLGDPLNYNAVASTFRRINRQIEFNTHPHQLRHTHLTEFSKTAQPHLVKERAGHSNIHTTYTYYVHPKEDEIEAAFVNSTAFDGSFL